MSEGLLFVVSGPSGAGKGTICREVAEMMDIALSVSMTTRSPRPGELEGKNYCFVSEKDFIRRIDGGGFLEYAKVYGNYYGTPKQAVLDQLEGGRDMILEIDIQGALQIKDTYPEGIFIFILPPSMPELRKRIAGRGSETEDMIRLRLGETLKEIAHIDRYDYCVVNGEVEEAVSKAAAIIKAEHCRISEEIHELVAKYKEEM
jgi:guanylate kinase